jgi:hypothetical protein
MLKGSLVAVIYTLCIASTTHTLTEDYRAFRPLNEFIYIDKDAKGADREVLNMMQITKVHPTWDTSILKSDRTAYNANWTLIKLTDGSTIIIKEEFRDVLNMIRRPCN